MNPPNALHAITVDTGSAANLQQMPDITVYTTVPCPYCSRAKALLAAREISYTEVNLGRDPDGRAELAQRTGLMTFPQIVIDGNTLGGWTELEQADADGTLAELLAG